MCKPPIFKVLEVDLNKFEPKLFYGAYYVVIIFCCKKFSLIDYR